jgi:hypothetical protein
VDKGVEMHIYPQPNGDIELGDFPARTNPDWCNVFWVATEICFLQCAYCVNMKPQVEPTSIFNRLGVSGIVDRFVQLRDTLQKKVMITISGGEPSMLKNFPELCEALFKRDFVIELHTNLSHPRISDWLQVAGKYPDQVSMVTASYHSWKLDVHKGLRDLYYKNFHDCWNAGLTTTLKVITPPACFGMLDADVARAVGMLPSGAPWLIWPFIHGIPQSRTNVAGAYPYSHTPAQKSTILRLGKYRLKSIEAFMNFPIFAKGSPCGSGSTFLLLDVQGNLHPCHTCSWINLGSFDTGVMNPYNGPHGCPNNRCLNSYWFLWDNTTAASYLGLSDKECTFNRFSNPTNISY